MSKSPSVFIGYYKKPEETEKTLKDGWLYSGDTGFIDEDGHLVVFDRTKDIMILSDGTQSHLPSFWRPGSNSARTSRKPSLWAIERPHVTAIVCIDYNTVGKWAEDNGINYTSYHGACHSIAGGLQSHRRGLS